MMEYSFKISFFLLVFFSTMHANNSRKIITLSGPSGVGKTTIMQYLVNSKNVEFFPTTTTRAMRDGEINGVDYHFITKQEFESRLSDFIEPQQIFENWYGPDRVLLEKKLIEGSDVVIIMIVTFDLAQNLKKIFPNSVINIFVAPPENNAKQILHQRLCSRGESEESVKRRLKNIEQELQQAVQADFIVINDNLETALENMQKIIYIKTRF